MEPSPTPEATRFTEPFNDPIAYGKSIARLANLLGDQIIV